MIIVLIVPTGLGAEIGGHAGDANPAAKLLASVCDLLITHPNVLSGSDINEMTDNTLSVEGSMLDRFLEGLIGLKQVRRNKILLVTNKPAKNETINAVSAARATLGAEISILELDEPLRMRAYICPEGDRASGAVSGYESLIRQVQALDFDALAIASEIEVDKETALSYLQNPVINPWGAVEAKLSKLVSENLNCPVAHAPIEDELLKYYNEVVDPRLAAEMISRTYLISVLKGLLRAPQVGNEITVKDVDFMVSPYGCWDRPHVACVQASIPIIVVEENSLPGGKGPRIRSDYAIFLQNYWEVAGYLAAERAGLDPRSVRRPLAPTRISRNP